MNHRRLPLAVVVSAALALAAWALGPPAESAPPPSVSTAPPPTAAPHGAATTPTVDRTDAAPAAGTTAPAAPATFRLRGRCLADADGTPIAGATVTLHDAGERAAARDRAPVLATATSATDGRFEVPTACRDEVAATIAAPGFAPMTGRWRAERPHAVDVDVGDVRLLAATIVEGEVVTDRGVPVEGAEVLLAVVKPEMPGFAPRTFATAESGADGRFRFAEPLPTGDWYAMANHAGGLIEPRNVHVPAGVDRHFVRVVTATPDLTTSIRGSIVDTDGAPLARLDLRANGDGATGSARTRQDGTFVLHRSGQFTNTGDRDVRLFVHDPANELELASEQPITRWGAGDVRVVMRRYAATTLVARDRTGAPVADLDAFLLRLGRSTVAREVRSRGRADGRTAVPRLASGSYVVLARPRDGGPPSAPVYFAVDQGIAPRELPVVLGQAEDLTVVVEDGGGAPVAGSRVEVVLALLGEPPAAGAHLPLLATAGADDLTRQPGIVVATATTDANGRASLPLPDGDWHLRVRGALHLPQVVPVAMRGRGSTAQIVVAAAGRIVGRCDPPAALARLRAAAGGTDAAIEVAAVQGDTTGARTAVAADGTFALEGLPAGTWTVRLSAPLRCSDEHTGSYPLPLGDVVVAGGTSKHTFAIDGALPASASGEVTLDGAPWPRVQLTFTRERPRSLVRAVADADGRFRTLLPPGEFVVSVAFPAQPGPGWTNVALPLRWAASPGGDERRTLAARTRTAKVRVLDATAAPVANARVRIDAMLGYYRPGALATDAHGVVTITQPPCEPFDLLVQTADRELRVGPIEALDDTGTTVLEARPRVQ
ncbi:MAG: hypothetical protein JNL08_12390 [Planctomycetes bacterium]|nr:hypothetical protein [Planctomycetota bacterium]